MKKIFFYGTLCAVAIATSLYGGNLVFGMNSQMSSDDLLLPNVEALTAGESSSSSGWWVNNDSPYAPVIIPCTSNYGNGYSAAVMSYRIECTYGMGDCTEMSCRPY